MRGLFCNLFSVSVFKNAISTNFSVLVLSARCFTIFCVCRFRCVFSELAWISCFHSPDRLLSLVMSEISCNFSQSGCLSFSLQRRRLRIILCALADIVHPKYCLHALNCVFSCWLLRSEILRPCLNDNTCGMAIMCIDVYSMIISVF